MKATSSSSVSTSFASASAAKQQQHGAPPPFGDQAPLAHRLARQEGTPWASEFAQQPQQPLSTWASQFNNVQTLQQSATAPQLTTAVPPGPAQTTRTPSWAADFASSSVTASHPPTTQWAQEFAEMTSDHPRAARWVTEFSRDVATAPAAPVLTDPTSSSAHHPPSAFVAAHADYHFAPNNPFRSSPPASLDAALATGTTHSRAMQILALEAFLTTDAGQANPGPVWSSLGSAHAANDSDDQAIACLIRALDAAPDNADAMLALGTSATNDFYKEEALNLLESWLESQPEYAHLPATVAPARADAASAGPWAAQFEQHARVSSLFLAAARLRPTQPDPRVQDALGLLYNLSYEYDKAVDCFRAAVSCAPTDARLWNKLGATLANSSRAPEAMQAYAEALRLDPTFVRAHSNQGIAHLALRSYSEAATAFARAIRLNEGDAGRTPAHLWPNLAIALRLGGDAQGAAAAEAKDPSILNRVLPPQ